jgi:hypothetical protein
METGQLFIYIVGAAGFTTVGALIYRVVFHVDSEKHRKEIQELKEKSILERLENVENEISDVKKKHSQKAEDTHKKHQEFELKFLELSTKMAGIESSIKSIDNKLDKILAFNNQSKIT